MQSLWVWIPLRRGILDTTLCDEVCQWLAAGLWFSLGTRISSTNKTDRHDLTEILLKVALNTPSPCTLHLMCGNQTLVVIGTDYIIAINLSTIIVSINQSTSTRCTWGRAWEIIGCIVTGTFNYQLMNTTS